MEKDVRMMAGGIEVELNNNGVLEPGLHKITFGEFYETFVEKFPSSQRRKEIFDSLFELVKSLTTEYEIYEVWVDGSFVTEKINPNDIDIIIFLEVSSFLKIGSKWSDIRSIGKNNNIDAYCGVAVNEESKKLISPEDLQAIINNRNYWRGQFGFDRADNPKGIIVISAEEICSNLKGGDINVNGSN